MVTKSRLARSCPELRRDQIIEIARQAFVEEGFAGTSMSTIAARVGGSKATLYKYFSSKEELFEAMMQAKCAEVYAAVQEMKLPEDDIAEFLTVFGCRFLKEIYSEKAVNLFRLVNAEGLRFPEIARVFFEQGPDTAYEQLGARLKGFEDRGLIRCPDPILTAQQFLGMIRGDLHTRVACGLKSPPSAEVIERHVRHAAALIAGGLAVS